ncbi:MAG: Stp1/IreP family PP2C-type Ser/Thr phosphatase [Clostridia bacterium]|nr:Stp1/IreP family PP2C-type Ser/Thr phosphatase [Clostridia bacterium]
MVIKVCGFTDKGKCRELNEDSFRICGFEDGQPLGVCVLADGMGGHNAGEIASSMAAEIVAGELSESLGETDDSKITFNMATAIDFANTSVFERSLRSREQSGMGTTLVVAYVKDALVRIANIGDSCAYVISDTKIQKITVDHSIVEELVQRGSITREEARNHPDKNIITRALGTEEFVDADFYDYNLSLGETVILCSDGLTETVTDERIKEIINENEDVKMVAESLIAEANKNGGVDNITVVVIRAQKEERI